MVGPRGKSHFRIAVFTILAVHIVLLGALLLQGCKRNETAPPGNTSLPPTNLISQWTPPPPPLPSGSSLTQRTGLPPLDGDTAPGIPPIDSSEPPPTLPSDPSIPVPPPVDPGLPPTDSGALPSPAPVETAQIQHTITSGDNFSGLAKKYGTTTKAIAQANPGKDPRRLQLGDTLLIPKAPATSSSNASDEAVVGRATYEVKSGDTLTKIAKDHNTSIRELRVANNLTSDRILVGQKLAIPK